MMRKTPNTTPISTWVVMARRALATSALSVVFACAGTTTAPLAAPTVATGSVVGQHGMVVSSNWRASEVGRRVLQTGGNAVDAAIATGFALAVTHPAAGNIGGGGFMIVRFPDGNATTIDFREKAPLRANPEMFLDRNGEYSAQVHHNSHLAVGVPGTVAGFALAHERYGNLAWRRLVTPSADLARDGFPLTETLATSFAEVSRRMTDYPASMYVFTKSGEPYQEGELWQQPDLARTLDRIAEYGRDGFYRGETARLVADEMRKHGGMITQEDLARYEARERAPIQGTYRGYDVISMPPPSSGGIALVEMLNILEGYNLSEDAHNSTRYIHRVVEAMRNAFRDRARYVADADFVDVPVQRLTGKAYANDLRTTIAEDRAGVSDPLDVQLATESMETTHYSVVDRDGMAVSVTYTLEAGYGSKIVVPGAGFLLNNEMGDFNPRPGLTTATGLIGTEPNLARPEQRMLSSMTPTILARGGELVAVFGSPGGRTIINTVLGMVLNIVDFQMPIARAVAAPRLHHQWLPDNVRIEADGITSQTLAALERMGYDVSVDGSQGSVSAIMIDPVSGARVGAADPRDTDSGASGH